MTLVYLKTKFISPNKTTKNGAVCDWCGEFLYKRNASKQCDTCVEENVGLAITDPVFLDSSKWMTADDISAIQACHGKTITPEIRAFISRLEEAYIQMDGVIPGKNVIGTVFQDNREYFSNESFFFLENRVKYYDPMVAGLLYAIVFAPQGYDFGIYMDAWSYLLSTSVYHITDQFRDIARLVAKFKAAILPHNIPLFLHEMLMFYLSEHNPDLLYPEVKGQLDHIISSTAVDTAVMYKEMCEEVNVAIENVILSQTVIGLKEEPVPLPHEFEAVLSLLDYVADTYIDETVECCAEIVVSKDMYCNKGELLYIGGKGTPHYYIRPQGAPVSFGFLRDNYDYIIPPTIVTPQQQYTFLINMDRYYEGKIRDFITGYKQVIHHSVCIDISDLFCSPNTFIARYDPDKWVWRLKALLGLFSDGHDSYDVSVVYLGLEYVYFKKYREPCECGLCDDIHAVDLIKCQQWRIRKRRRVKAFAENRFPVIGYLPTSDSMNIRAIGPNVAYRAYKLFRKQRTIHKHIMGLMTVRSQYSHLSKRVSGVPLELPPDSVPILYPVKIQQKKPVVASAVIKSSIPDWLGGPHIMCYCGDMMCSGCYSPSVT